MNLGHTFVKNFVPVWNVRTYPAQSLTHYFKPKKTTTLPRRKDTRIFRGSPSEGQSGQGALLRARARRFRGLRMRLQFVRASLEAKIAGDRGPRIDEETREAFPLAVPARNSRRRHYSAPTGHSAGSGHTLATAAFFSGQIGQSMHLSTPIPICHCPPGPEAVPLSGETERPRRESRKPRRENPISIRIACKRRRRRRHDLEACPFQQLFLSYASRVWSKINIRILAFGENFDICNFLLLLLFFLWYWSRCMGPFWGQRWFSGSVVSPRRLCKYVERASRLIDQQLRHRVRIYLSYGGTRIKKRGKRRGEEDECAVAVVARRRSEGTHPINKTTRVTIKFNREKNGFQSAKEGWGGGARRDPRSKSPCTYAPLLFIVPNFHSQRNLLTICWFVKEREREASRGEDKERTTALASSHTAFGISFFFFVSKWTTRILSFFSRDSDWQNTVDCSKNRKEKRVAKKEIILRICRDTLEEVKSF